jgi:NTE family protein
MSQWREKLSRWRCGLSASERQDYGVGSRWNCHDLKFFVGRISFEQLGNERAAELNAIPTRFQLSPQGVQTLVTAGQEALRTNPTFLAFVASLGGRTFSNRLAGSSE